MLGLEDSDEDTFSNSSFGDSAANRLGSLFGGKDEKSSSNTSLKYTAKKRPSNASETPPTTPTTPTVLHATAVHLYQYKTSDRKFEPIGKVGCAILATPGATQTNFQLLCYRSSKDYVCQAPIAHNFNFTIQNTQYGSFYDVNQQLWSLLFPTPDDAFHFGIFVGIAKYASQINSVSQQQLEVSQVNLNEQASSKDSGEEDCVRVGSKVGVKYTGWLLQRDSSVSYKLGKAFDSNAGSDKLFRFKVGNNEVIKGWDKGILGMRVGGRRFLVIPAAYAYGDAGRSPVIPPNTPLCFQIEVVKIRNSPTVSTTSSPVLSPPTSFESTGPLVANPQKSKKQQLKKAQQFGTPSPFVIGHYKTDESEEEESVELPQPQQPVQTVSPQPVQQQQPVQSVQPVQQTQPVQQQVEQPQQPKNDPQLDLLQQQIASLQAIIQKQQAVTELQNSQQSSTSEKNQKKKKYRKKKGKKSSESEDPEDSDHDSDVSKKSEAQKAKEEPVTTVNPVLAQEQVSKLMERLDLISGKIDHIAEVQTIQQKSVLDNDENKNDKLMSGAVLIANLQHILQTNEQLKTELATERDNVDSLVEKVSLLRKRNEKYAKESYQSAQEQENEHLVSQLDLAKKQLTDLKRKCNRLEEQLESERETQTQVQADSDIQIKQLRKQFEDQKQHSREREQHLQNEIAGHIKFYEEQLKNQSSESMKLLQSNEMEKSQREQLLQNQLQQVQSKLSQTLNELSRSQSELTQAQTDLAEKDIIISQKQSKINLLEGKSTNSVQRLVDLEEELNELRGQLNDSQKTTTSLNRQVDQLKNSLQDKHRELLEAQESLQEAISDHEETLAQLKETFKTRVEEFQNNQQEASAQTLQEALRWMVKNTFSTVKDDVMQGNLEKKYKGQKIVTALANVLRHYMVTLIDNVNEGVEVGDIEAEKPEDVEISDDESEETETRPSDDVDDVEEEQEEPEEETEKYVPVDSEEQQHEEVEAVDEVVPTQTASELEPVVEPEEEIEEESVTEETQVETETATETSSSVVGNFAVGLLGMLQKKQNVEQVESEPDQESFFDNEPKEDADEPEEEETTEQESVPATVENTEEPVQTETVHDTEEQEEEDEEKEEAEQKQEEQETPSESAEEEVDGEEEEEEEIDEEEETEATEETDLVGQRLTDFDNEKLAYAQKPKSSNKRRPSLKSHQLLETLEDLDGESSITLPSETEDTSVDSSNIETPAEPEQPEEVDTVSQNQVPEEQTEEQTEEQETPVESNIEEEESSVQEPLNASEEQEEEPQDQFFSNPPPMDDDEEAVEEEEQEEQEEEVKTVTPVTPKKSLFVDSDEDDIPDPFAVTTKSSPAPILSPEEELKKQEELKKAKQASKSKLFSADADDDFFGF